MNGVEWTAFIGGISGFISLIVVIIERILTHPKVEVQIIETSVFEASPSSIDSWYNYHFRLEAEIGNTGKELTTIVQAFLSISELANTYTLRFQTDNKPSDFGRVSLPMEPGFAGFFSFWVIVRVEKPLKCQEFQGKLKLKQLGGKITSRDIKFKLKSE